jgi:hypothetical protein
VDACHEGFRYFFEALPAEPPGHKGCKFWDDEVQAHADFSGPRDEPGLREGPERGRDHEHHAFGQCMECSPRVDIGAFILVVGREQFRSEAEVLCQIHGPDLLRKKTIGSAFDQKVAVFLGQKLAADATALFEQQDLDGFAMGLGACFEMDGGGKAGDPTAYDDDLQHE